MRIIERPFSDLLRHPKDVATDLDDGDVLLRRRDEPDLRLSLADREEARAETFAAVGRTLRNLAVHAPTALADALRDALPWLEFLPAADRRLFVDEFSRVVVAAAELDNYTPLDQVVREWRATAVVYADPTLAKRLRRAIDADGQSIDTPAG